MSLLCLKDSGLLWPIGTSSASFSSLSLSLSHCFRHTSLPSFPQALSPFPPQGTCISGPFGNTLLTIQGIVLLCSLHSVPGQVPFHQRALSLIGHPYSKVQPPGLNSFSSHYFKLPCLFFKLLHYCLSPLISM